MAPFFNQSHPEFKDRVPDNIANQYTTMGYGPDAAYTTHPRFNYRGFTEVHAPDRNGNPYLDRPLMGMKPESSPEWVMGEYAHVLAQQKDPYYQWAVNQFSRAGQDNKEFQKALHEQALRDHIPKERFEDWYDESGREAWVRAAAFPRSFGGPEWARAIRDVLSPEQQKYKQMLIEYLRQRPGQTDLPYGGNA